MKWSALALCAAFCLLAATSPLTRAQALILPPAPMSAEDLRAVYEELAQTHDGFVYTVNLLGYPSEEAARKSWDQMQQPRFRIQRLDRIFKNVTPRNLALYSVDAPLREKLANLSEGERSGPVLTRRGWVIAEVVSMRVAPAPSFEQAAAGIPGLVAAGTLPSAEQLREDPVLRSRTAANRIVTADDLKAAPADLDVNQKLSSATTLLLRALLRDRTDLVEALLRRGANANQCAHRFCPVQLAIFRKAPAAVDALLKAGADPNQRDPSIGVPEGPLAAAAYKGDVPLAGRLIAAGAKVDGTGKGESPLMAAASAADRPMVEFLLAKGADPFAVIDTAPARGALDSAERSKNAEFAAWLRGVLRAKAKESGQYDWEGWIEQEGRRQPMDGRPVQLKKAPFRIVVRMKPDRLLFATASGSPRVFEEVAKGGPDNPFLEGGRISAEGAEADGLIVHEPQKADARWGGSQAWWKDATGSRFASVVDTPQGREHIREVRRLIVIDADDRIGESIGVAAFPGQALHLVLGTRIRMTYMDDELFGSRNVELRFAP